MNVHAGRDIKPFVATTRWLDAVRLHSSPVIQEAGVYHYYAPGATKSKTLTGITSLMSAHLVGKRKRGTPKFRRARGRRGGGGGGGKLQDRLSGFMRGSLVHRQVEDAVLLDAENFLRRHPEGMHAWARALFDGITAMGWRPLVAEYIVYDLTLGAATRIDLIAVDKKGRLIVIETKTGYADGAFEHDHHAGRWRPAFLDARADVDLPCSPRNQAAMQATLGTLMLARTLQLPARAYKVYVAHIEQNTVRFVAVPRRFLIDTGVPCYQHLAEVRNAPPKAATTPSRRNKTQQRRA